VIGATGSPRQLTSISMSSIDERLPGFDNDRPTVEPAPPAQAHSATSVEAALTIRPVFGRQRRLLLKVLAEFGAMSDEGLQNTTGLPGSSERPRRVELMRLGLVRQCGEGTTLTGRRCALWAISDAGLEAIDRTEAVIT
jgi:hypothetical protein